MRIALLAVLIASPALFAQGNVTSPTGFGRILFPGGTAPSAGTGASPFGRIIFPGTGAPASVTTTTNAPLPPPNVPHPAHGGSGLIAYPVYLPVGNYLQYTPPQAPMASSYTSTPQVPEAPVVIVNQYFRPDPAMQPEVSLTQPVPAPEERVTSDNQDKETIFLIAMKDHTIYAASSYWVEDGTLNYVTIQGSQNSASLDLVDRDLSRRLNKNRNVAFGLPNN
jgi:hypothetical protein